jgi:hypothetical protein
MSGWECPDCGGGFPSPVEEGEGQLCPWCSRGLRHEWEPDERPVVSRVKKDEEEEESSTLLGKLFH